MKEAPAQQTSNSNADQQQCPAPQGPWVPDNQDAANVEDYLADLQPGASREQVIEALKKQIASLDATITDLATGITGSLKR